MKNTLHGIPSQNQLQTSNFFERYVRFKLLLVEFLARIVMWSEQSHQLCGWSDDTIDRFFLCFRGKTPKTEI